jgi:Raf kinase inhibitor-like YbhB/YbcL family protein
MPVRKIISMLLSCLIATNAVCAASSEFSVSSDEVNPGAMIKQEQVFNGFGCSGANVSPSLHWQGAPPATKSFAITVYDPDAPTGHGWWHWLVFNIPVNVKGLEKGAGDPTAAKLPEGSVQSRTDFGKSGYGGPCPPPGDKPHNYIFTVYALKTDKLSLDENAPPSTVSARIEHNSIGKAVLKAKYGR